MTVKVSFGKKYKAITWLDVIERGELSDSISKDFQFPNSIEIIDGTLFPLEFKPTVNGEDYWTKKVL